MIDMVNEPLPSLYFSPEKQKHSLSSLFSFLLIHVMSKRKPSTFISCLSELFQYIKKSEMGFEPGKFSVSGRKARLRYVRKRPLAWVLHDQGKYKTAEELTQRASETAEHPDSLLTSIHSLCIYTAPTKMYHCTGDLSPRRQKLFGSQPCQDSGMLQPLRCHD